MCSWLSDTRRFQIPLRIEYEYHQHAYDMTPTGLRLKLLALLNDHPSCQTVLRDWEWYLGRELQSSDFAADSIAEYVDALSGELREDQLLTLQAILRAAWEVGHTAGLIDEEPPRS